jgi:hypothetical protein
LVFIRDYILVSAADQSPHKATTWQARPPLQVQIY